MAKHKKQTETKKNMQKAAVVVVGGGIVLAANSTTPALAAPSDWDVISSCESGGQNVESHSTISSASGYFQIIDGTWAGAGGLEFAPRAIDATYEQQLIVAQRIAERRGSLADWNESKGCWGDQITDDVPVAPETEEVVDTPAPVEVESTPITNEETHTVVQGECLSEIAPDNWREIYEANVDVIGANPDLIIPGQVLKVGGLMLASAPVTIEEEPAGEEVQSVEDAGATVASNDAAAAPELQEAPIANSAGPVSSNTRLAANTIFTNVPGAQLITIGGTRASARDPHGHPSGNALDYMVLSDAALGDAIAQYNIDNWDILGVEYIIWQQRILTAPDGSWEWMADRGSITQNHYDHVHVNYSE